MICLTEKFIDFYAVLGVRPDASQEEIRAAYDRKKREASSLGRNALGSDMRDKLLEMAIAVLGSENRRMGYDFNGAGGVVSLDANWEDSLSPEALGINAAPSAENWGESPAEENGSVIQGSKRGEADDHDPSFFAGGPPGEASLPPAASGRQPPFTQLSGQTPTESRRAHTEPGFVLRVTAQMDGRRAWENPGHVSPSPYRRSSVDASEENSFSASFSRITFAVGGVFALLLSIIWMLELPLLGGLLRENGKTLLKNFLLAANETHIVKLWVLLFIGGFLFWCAEFFAIQSLTWVLEGLPGNASDRRRRDAQRWRGRILAAEIFLFLAIFVWIAYSNEDMPFVSNSKIAWKLAGLFFSQLYFFLPLFLVTGFAGRNVWIAVVWQVMLLAGHMLFVLLLSRLLFKSISPADYFVGGFFKFGYGSWWVFYFSSCKLLDRMKAP